MRLHKREAVEEREVVVDTTVQEKNITFPTDTKLYRKITEQCVKIAKTEGIGIRRSYVRTIKRLIFAQRGRGHPRGHNKAVSATKKLGTIAGDWCGSFSASFPPRGLTVMQRYLEFTKGF